ncbi:FMN-binding negative transcriptional regulator [Parasphingopyxis algicola]|uniref:FMN-binding negative transcriptional regulator n=1 Tax=Parasphingopyxis algicola TaxID=2026624 RepID=UPI00159F8E65|nr:FMN-binding negative transcriptional regulator [Parasphingopyxis algicola]QLC25800.1 FMN-binding negative transcriptional regulator [Parasphingopyxis algicola]
MHPNPRFHWQDRGAMAEFVEQVGFGMVFAETPDGPRVAHIPAILEDGRLLFHLAKGNALTRYLDERTALFVVNGPDAYVSPDWYGEADQVPTWNYVAVELEGPVSMLSKDALVAQADALSAAQEARFDKTPWTRAKMKDGLFEKMLGGITGFALEPRAWRGTIKLNQNKPEEAIRKAADEIEANGRPAIAHWMRNLPS